MAAKKVKVFEHKDAVTEKGFDRDTYWANRKAGKRGHGPKKHNVVAWHPPKAWQALKDREKDEIEKLRKAKKAK